MTIVHTFFTSLLFTIHSYFVQYRLRFRSDESNTIKLYKDFHVRVEIQLQDKCFEREIKAARDSHVNKQQAKRSFSKSSSSQYDDLRTVKAWLFV